MPNSLRPGQGLIVGPADDRTHAQQYALGNKVHDLTNTHGFVLQKGLLSFAQVTCSSSFLFCIALERVAMVFCCKQAPYLRRKHPCQILHQVHKTALACAGHWEANRSMRSSLQADFFKPPSDASSAVPTRALEQTKILQQY